MSEISETEIKSMTKEQNYMRGYKDGKSDVFDEIRAKIEEVYNDRPRGYNHTQRRELFCKVIEIIDNYKAESEI